MIHGTSFSLSAFGTRRALNDNARLSSNGDRVEVRLSDEEAKFLANKLTLIIHSIDPESAKSAVQSVRRKLRKSPILELSEDEGAYLARELDEMWFESGSEEDALRKAISRKLVTLEESKC